MDTNNVKLCGVIKNARSFTSPAGIKHKIVTLEHRSLRSFTNLTRNIYCLIQVVADGNAKFAKQLQVGVEVEISGFITLRYNKNQETKLLLYAESVDVKN